MKRVTYKRGIRGESRKKTKRRTQRTVREKLKLQNRNCLEEGKLNAVKVKWSEERGKNVHTVQK